MTWAHSYLALDIGPIWQERDGPPEQNQDQTVQKVTLTDTHTAQHSSAPRFATTSATASTAPKLTPRINPASIKSPEAALTPLLELKARLASCVLCPISQTRTQTVFGNGVDRPEWLILGESPGYYEDLAGEAFVGRAGQLLDQALHAVQIDRHKNAYITNAIKCRAANDGKDRQPTDIELRNCTTYLHEQIDLLAPRLICVLGESAARSLLQLPSNDKVDISIDSLREQIFKYKNIPVVVSYHPTHLLRTPADKRLFWHDLCRAKNFLESAA